MAEYKNQGIEQALNRSFRDLITFYKYRTFNIENGGKETQNINDVIPVPNELLNNMSQSIEKEKIAGDGVGVEGNDRASEKKAVEQYFQASDSVRRSVRDFIIFIKYVGVAELSKVNIPSDRISLDLDKT